MEAQSTGSLLEIRNATQRFSGFAALRNVDFRLAAGSVHALVGENGAGKTTLVKIISGMLQPTEGQILLDGKPVTVTPENRRDLGISIVPQHVEFFPHLDLAENIFMDDLPMRGPFIDRCVLYSRAREWFDRFGLPFSPDTPMRELSFVQQKVLTILKALKDNGRIVILDEPTASLHVHEIDQLFGFIREFNARGVSFIYISHHLQEIFDICDRVTVLRDGVVRGSFPIAELDLKRLVETMVGGEVEQLRAGRAVSEGRREALGVAGLTCGGMVRDVGFSLREGEVLGVVSNRGSGKNELVEALFGVTPAKAGVIRVFGKEGTIASPSDAMAKGLMLLPEDRHHQGLFLDKSIRTNITAASLKAMANAWGKLDARKEEAVADRLIGELGVACSGGSQHTRFLSGGNQQKVVVGKILEAGPRIILLDSPTVGVDIKARTEIHRLIRRLAEEGKAVMVLSSDLEEIVALCDRVLVLSRGRITREVAAGDDAFNVRSLGVLIEGGQA